MEDLLIDCTEINIQIPDNQAVQQSHDSGKKRHAVKPLTISDGKKRILYVGKLWTGDMHEISVFKEEFSFINFRGKGVHVDLGFEGIKDMMKNAKVSIRFKKPEGKLLDELQKNINRLFSGFRVRIANALGGCKRFFINQMKSGMKEREEMLEKFQLSAGLHNYQLKYSNA